MYYLQGHLSYSAIILTYQLQWSVRINIYFFSYNVSRISPRFSHNYSPRVCATLRLLLSPLVCVVSFCNLTYQVISQTICLATIIIVFIMITPRPIASRYILLFGQCTPIRSSHNIAYVRPNLSQCR